MKRYLPLVLVVTAMSTAGCYWISGPWTHPQEIHKKYDRIEIGMLREEVDDILGDPSEIKYVTNEAGEIPEGSKEAWLLYKYDYPQEPLLITVKVDYFGIVTEKHFDNKETLAEQAARKTYEQKLSYPGAPLKEFQEIQRRKNRGEQ